MIVLNHLHKNPTLLFSSASLGLPGVEPSAANFEGLLFLLKEFLMLLKGIAPTNCCLKGGCHRHYLLPYPNQSGLVTNSSPWFTFFFTIRESRVNGQKTDFYVAFLNFYALQLKFCMSLTNM